MAGIYMMQGVEDENEEAWKETRVEIRGMFEGFQRLPHEEQREQEEKEKGRGDEEEDGEEGPRGEWRPLEMPDLGRSDQQEAAREYLQGSPGA